MVRITQISKDNFWYRKYTDMERQLLVYELHRYGKTTFGIGITQIWKDNFWQEFYSKITFGKNNKKMEG